MAVTSTVQLKMFECELKLVVLTAYMLLSSSVVGQTDHSTGEGFTVQFNAHLYPEPTVRQTAGPHRLMSPYKKGVVGYQLSYHKVFGQKSFVQMRAGVSATPFFFNYSPGVVHDSLGIVVHDGDVLHTSIGRLNRGSFRIEYGENLLKTKRSLLIWLAGISVDHLFNSGDHFFHFSRSNSYDDRGIDLLTVKVNYHETPLWNLCFGLVYQLTLGKYTAVVAEIGASITSIDAYTGEYILNPSSIRTVGTITQPANYVSGGIGYRVFLPKPKDSRNEN